MQFREIWVKHGNSFEAKVISEPQRKNIVWRQRVTVALVTRLFSGWWMFVADLGLVTGQYVF